ncbi:putative amino acid transporter [Dactylonectria estremocensis]|uniref:Amino acid transporter n=1 Tax=Dactylonectria estremocensis TaxID=1079267 RepID=A0A9P9D851_9HYPO|nr:putative amino acid transporter [Dactylonectria estremocensis]
MTRQQLQKSQSAIGSNSWLTGNASHVSEPIHLDGNRFSLVISAGGSPFYFWAFIVAATFQLMVALSLAELASAYPHTSGQAYWASRLAPDRFSSFLTHWVGICACWGWLFGLAGTAAFAGDFLLALGTLTVGSFNRELWQVYLTVLVMGLVALCFNTVGIKPFSKVTFPSVLFLNAATVFIFVALLIKTSPKAVVFLLSLLPGSVAVGLFDAPTHGADEMSRPSEQVPKVMIGTTILNIVSTLIVFTGVLFCLNKPENLFEPMAGLAFIQLGWDAFPKLGFIITVTAVYCYINLFATFTILLKVNPKLQVPVNAIVLMVVLICLVNLLVLGPLTTLPHNRSFNLGRFGAAINIAALCFCLVLGVITNFPTFVPVEPLTMNWTSAHVRICVLVTLGNWFFARDSYQPPQHLYKEPTGGPEIAQPGIVYLFV